jgi:hypothetical protein
MSRFAPEAVIMEGGDFGKGAVRLPFEGLLPCLQEFIAEPVIPIRYFQQGATAGFIFLSCGQLAHFLGLVVIVLSFDEWPVHIGDFEMSRLLCPNA